MTEYYELCGPRRFLMSSEPPMTCNVLRTFMADGKSRRSLHWAGPGYYKRLTRGNHRWPHIEYWLSDAPTAWLISDPGELGFTEFLGGWRSHESFCGAIDRSLGHLNVSLAFFRRAVTMARFNLRVKGMNNSMTMLALPAPKPIPMIAPVMATAGAAAAR